MCIEIPDIERRVAKAEQVQINEIVVRPIAEQMVVVEVTMDGTRCDRQKVRSPLVRGVTDVGNLRRPFGTPVDKHGQAFVQYGQFIGDQMTPQRSHPGLVQRRDSARCLARIACQGRESLTGHFRLNPHAQMRKQCEWLGNICARLPIGSEAAVPKLLLHGKAAAIGTLRADFSISCKRPAVLVTQDIGDQAAAAGLVPDKLRRFDAGATSRLDKRPVHLLRFQGCGNMRDSGVFWATLKNGCARHII